ncbi:MAG: hypothetical protein EXX96DRAFT_591924 [Benjaminiella poitrasii]|nr:MAG: hypothetical protein EXX96DRAFT_591924 [Benjaminiella poitrasii]
MLTAPYVHLNTPRKVMIYDHSHDNNSTATTTTTAMIDYTNLYIKNLDPEITSYDLFKKFRIYGKIISARVMKDTATGISKGYGFVSFTTMEEASEALQQMNGSLLNTKHIAVTYHTHKKKGIINQHNGGSSIISPIIQYQMSNKSPLIPHPNISHNNNNNPWNHHEPSSATSTTGVTPPAYRTTTTTNHHTTLPQQQQQTLIISPSSPPLHSPLIDLSSNTSSYYLLTDNHHNTSIQLQKLREAISQHLTKEEQERDLDDLVDLIQSLKKRELSLCLFNPHIMKQKIDEAYDALYLFKTTTTTTTTSQKARLMMMSTTHNVVEYNAAMAILNSLEGMSLNKQKRIFGDIFFPYVRATGIKHAPKVTIQLLDTIPLNELAFIMYDKPELTKKAQHAYAQLYLTTTNTEQAIESNNNNNRVY